MKNVWVVVFLAILAGTASAEIIIGNCVSNNKTISSTGEMSIQLFYSVDGASYDVPHEFVLEPNENIEARTTAECEKLKADFVKEITPTVAPLPIEKNNPLFGKEYDFTEKTFKPIQEIEPVTGFFESIFHWFKWLKQYDVFGL